MCQYYGVLFLTTVWQQTVKQGGTALQTALVLLDANSLFYLNFSTFDIVLFTLVYGQK